jgi:hypothetical protein
LYEERRHLSVMKRKLILATTVSLALFLAASAFSQQGQGQGRGGQGGQAQPQQQQPQAAAQPPGVVTGQVVNAATGEPLRKVTLSLRPQGRGGSATTGSSDTAGNFRLGTVEPGTYTLSGERTGFVRGAYGEDKGGQARTIDVASGKTVTSIQLRLMPHSVITGRVFDQDGDPIQNASVQAMRYSYPQGQRQLNTVQQATTNDLGEFRIAGLAPGRYYVSANSNGVLGTLQGAVADLLQNRGGGGPGGPGGVGGRGGRGAILDQILGRGGDVDPDSFVTTFYPRAIQAASATPIDLVAGSEARGIDIGLQKARKFTVSGLVEGLPAANAQPQGPQQGQQQGNAKQKGKAQGGPGGFGGAFITLIPRSSQQQPGIANVLDGGASQVNPDGTFEIRNVQPGAYYLMAQARGQQQDLSARVPVDVANGDLKSLRVRLTPALAVSGRIAPEKSDTTLNLQNVRLNFNSSSPQGAGGRGGGRQGRINIAADGKFQTELSADTYNVEITNAPAGFYLKTVKLAGQPVPNNVLDLAFSGGVVDVVLANDAGTITGKVERSNGDPVQNARVTLVPATATPRRDLYKNVTSGADGTFTLSTVPPGSYKIFAWEEVETNAWMDADFRRPFEALGANATIRDGAGPNVTLKLIGREQMVLAGVQ